MTLLAKESVVDVTDREIQPVYRPLPVKFSRVSKLDGIRSWSLPAMETCPGAVSNDGNLVAVCQGCYARSGHYRFKNVADIRAFNMVDWQKPDWVDRMVKTLDNDRYFRWFDSGDIYSSKLAQKILDVCTQTPWTKHWLPTRSYKIETIRPVLEKITQLDNVAVRYSSDSIDGQFDAINGSTVIPYQSALPEGAVLCSAYETSRCDLCRDCWDKSIAVIAYVAHGRRMSKLIASQSKTENCRK